MCASVWVRECSKKPYSHVCCAVHPVLRADMEIEIMRQPQNVHLRLSKLHTCLFASPAFEIRPHSVMLQGKSAHVCMHTLEGGRGRGEKTGRVRVYAWMREVSRLIWQTESWSCLFLALWTCFVKGISLSPSKTGFHNRALYIFTGWLIDEKPELHNLQAFL